MRASTVSCSVCGALLPDRLCADMVAATGTRLYNQVLPSRDRELAALPHKVNYRSCCLGPCLRVWFWLRLCTAVRQPRSRDAVHWHRRLFREVGPKGGRLVSMEGRGAADDAARSPHGSSIHHPGLHVPDFPVRACCVRRALADACTDQACQLQSWLCVASSINFLRPQEVENAWMELDRHQQGHVSVADVQVRMHWQKCAW